MTRKSVEFKGVGYASLMILNTCFFGNSKVLTARMLLSGAVNKAKYNAFEFLGKKYFCASLMLWDLIRYLYKCNCKNLQIRQSLLH